MSLTALTTTFSPLWLWCMILALAFWGARVLIDEYLTKSQGDNAEDAVYKEAVYGTVISGRFAGYASVPLLIIYAVRLRGQIAIEDMICLIVAGALYLLHYHYFFILMKQSEDCDAAWTESAASANLVLTPIILFVLLNEAFNQIVVLGITLVALSIGVLFFRTRHIVLANKGTLLCFVATFSVSSILSDYAYDGHDQLITIIALLGFFYLGMGLCGRAFYLSVHQPETKTDINQIVKSKFAFLSFAEFVDLIGTFFFQIGIAVTPSIILALAMLEFMPIAVMIIATTMLCLSASRHLRQIAKAQFQEGTVKLTASIFTFIGAILIIGAEPIKRAMPDIRHWGEEVTQSTVRMVKAVQRQEVPNVDTQAALPYDDSTTITPPTSMTGKSRPIEAPEHYFTDQGTITQNHPSDPSHCNRPYGACLTDADLLEHLLCQSIYAQSSVSLDARHTQCRTLLAAYHLPDEPLITLAPLDPADICPDTGRTYRTTLTRDEIIQVQLGLSAYGQQHPTAEITLPVQSIDGLYGIATCRAIVKFEQVEHLASVTGQLDRNFYDIMAQYNIDITQQKNSLTRLNSKPRSRARQTTLKPDKLPRQPSKTAPTNPWDRIKYCSKLENRHTKGCESPTQPSVQQRR